MFSADADWPDAFCPLRARPPSLSKPQRNAARLEVCRELEAAGELGGAREQGDKAAAEAETDAATDTDGRQDEL